MTLRKGPVPPENRPIAFLSDVHGNLPALEAVLEELARRDVGTIVVAGDHVLGGDAPLETYRKLTQSGAKLVRGLSDTALVSVDPSKLKPANDAEREKAEAFKRTREALGDLVIEQLRRLPDRLRMPLIDGREVLVVHGSPLDATREVTFDMGDEEVHALMDDDPADIVVCGASPHPVPHRARRPHGARPRRGRRAARGAGRAFHDPHARDGRDTHPPGLRPVLTSVPEAHGLCVTRPRRASRRRRHPARCGA